MLLGVPLAQLHPLPGLVQQSHGEPFRDGRAVDAVGDGDADVDGFGGGKEWVGRVGVDSGGDEVDEFELWAVL